MPPRSARVARARQYSAARPHHTRAAVAHFRSSHTPVLCMEVNRLTHVQHAPRPRLTWGRVVCGDAGSWHRTRGRVEWAVQPWGGSRRGRLVAAAAITAAAAAAAVAAAAAAGRGARRALDEVTPRARHVDGLHFASLLDDLELDFLALHQRAEARGVDGRLVDEEVLAARRRRDEAEALLRVEPLDSANLLAVRRVDTIRPFARLLSATAATSAAATTTTGADDRDGLLFAVFGLLVIRYLLALIEGAARRS